MAVCAIEDIPLACLVVLSSAACTDLSCRRIPNELVISAGIAGIAYHALKRPYTDGLFFSLAGLMVGGVLLMIPYLKAWVGGGDVKLLAAMGAWLGPLRIVHMFIYGSMAGGIMAVLVLLRGWKHDFQSKGEKASNGKKMKKAGLPYAIALAAGYILLLTMGERF